MSSPKHLLDYPEHMKLPYGPFMGFVEHVHDGDTLTVNVDVGFGHFPVVAIRLENIECPELWQDGGPSAAAFVAYLCDHGSPVVLSTGLTPKSRKQKRTFTRYVGIIKTGNGEDLGDLIYDAGLGKRPKGWS